MKYDLKSLSLLSASMLLGCVQLTPTPLSSQPLAQRVQPVQRISSPVSEIESLFVLGRAAHEAGHLALAEECYDKILQKQPLHLGTINSIAVIYAQTGRVDKALEFFRKALELNPKVSYVHNNFGYVLLRNGQLAEAESELALARGLDPANVQTRRNLELLAQAKTHAVAELASSEAVVTAEAPSNGPKLVAVGPNMYELRDSVSSASAAAQTPTATALQMEKSAVQAKAGVVTLDRAISTSLHGVRLEVSNGAGIRYLARRTAHRLSLMGIVTARMTNQVRFRQINTEIQFGAGQEDAAEALAMKLPVAVRTVARARLDRNMQLRLVLGHDLRGDAVAEWLESSTGTGIAMVDEAGWRWS